MKIKHPNVVNIVDSFNSEIERAIFFVIEYCDGGDLQKQIKSRIIKNLPPASQTFIKYFIA
jgi:serine/threonine protein kinase